jgi:hypothetical protein
LRFFARRRAGHPQASHIAAEPEKTPKIVSSHLWIGKLSHVWMRGEVGDARLNPVSRLGIRQVGLSHFGPIPGLFHPQSVHTATACG